MENRSPHVVVLGAGFGGLTFCEEFYCPPAQITIVDQKNHHLFQPLLYQVATAGLSAPEIAQPIRSIFSECPNITVLLDKVADINLTDRTVTLETNLLHYDYLILALGSVTSYFGHPEWEKFAPGLKSLEDAIRIRRDLLMAFEKAESTSDEGEHDRLLTMVVVGGGPTGVELAGAFVELARYVLANDFRRIDPRQTRVILIEAGPRLLAQFSPESSASAERQLREMGVEIRTSTRVKNISQGAVELEGETIRAQNIVWAAGVCPNQIVKKLGVLLDRSGRVAVNQDLSLPERPEVFVIGDMASVRQEDGSPVPGVAPAAMQMARHVAKILADEITSAHPDPKLRHPFHYFDKGTMATIGRSAAVAEVRGFKFSGFPAWMAWLIVHLLFLIGLRNKIKVLMDWGYAYLAYKRGARIITSPCPEDLPDE